MRSLLAMAWLAFAAFAPQTTPAADDLARQLQTRYDTVKSFTADFTHVWRAAAVPQTKTERGTVEIRKPGHINFTTTSPAPAQTVSDGTQMIVWTGLKQADRFQLTPDAQSTWTTFLAGRGNLLRDFTPSLPAPQPDGEWKLALKPKTPQTDFVMLSLFVERMTLALAGYELTTTSGDVSTFRFSNLKENVSLPDADFVFKRSGVKIVDR